MKYDHVLETNRLILKGLTLQNMEYIFKNSSKEAIKAMLGHQNDEDFENEEFKVRNGYASYNRIFVLFLLIHKESGQIIGRCGLHNWNVENKRAEIGYNMVLENYRQNGLMSEAVLEIMHFGFNKLNLNRIEALVGIANVPSLKIMEKFKFRKEGVLREHIYKNEGFEDSVLFSLLKNEFPAYGFIN